MSGVHFYFSTAECGNFLIFSFSTLRHLEPEEDQPHTANMEGIQLMNMTNFLWWTFRFYMYANKLCLKNIYFTIYKYTYSGTINYNRK